MNVLYTPLATTAILVYIPSLCVRRGRMCDDSCDKCCECIQLSWFSKYNCEARNQKTSCKVFTAFFLFSVLVIWIVLDSLEHFLEDPSDGTAFAFFQDAEQYEWTNLGAGGGLAKNEKSPQCVEVTLKGDDIDWAKRMGFEQGTCWDKLGDDYDNLYTLIECTERIEAGEFNPAGPNKVLTFSGLQKQTRALDIHTCRQNWVNERRWPKLRNTTSFNMEKRKTLANNATTTVFEAFPTNQVRNTYIFWILGLNWRPVGLLWILICSMPIARCFNVRSNDRAYDRAQAQAEAQARAQARARAEAQAEAEAQSKPKPNSTAGDAGPVTYKYSDKMLRL